MRTIWKFQLEVTDIQTIFIPKGAKFLTVNLQRGIPCLWFEVDSDAPKIASRIVTVGTGHRVDWMSSAMKYLGTYQQLDGEFIGHVYIVEND